MDYQTQIQSFTDEQLATLIDDETATETLGLEADKIRREFFSSDNVAFCFFVDR